MKIVSLLAGAALVVVVLAAAVLVLPSEEEYFRAIARSRPQPKLEAFFRRKLADNPRHVAALRELIRIERHRGRFAREIELRERLRTLEPGAFDNLEQLMVLYGWESRNEEALALGQHLLSLKPDRQDLRERLMELYEFVGHPEAALPHAMWLLERGVRNERVIRVVLAARDVAGIAAAIADPRARAEAFVSVGAQEEAIASYGEHLAAAPSDHAARLMLAKLCLWNARPLEAAEHFERYLAGNSDADVRRELLRIYEAFNRTDLMLPHLEDGPRKAEILLAFGRVDEAKSLLIKLGDLERLVLLTASDEEEIALRELLPMTPENRRRVADLYAWRREFARAYRHYEALGDARAVDMKLASGDLAGAIECARRLGAYERCSQMCLWNGDVDGAIADLRKVPGKERAIVELFIWKERFDEAVALLDTLSLEAHERAELYLRAQRQDRSARILQNIPTVELDAERAAALGREMEPLYAEQVFRRLVRHYPDRDEYWIALVRACDYLGDHDEALRMLRVLLERPFARGDSSGAPSPLERSLELAREGPQFVRMLAEIAYADQRREDAVRLYEEYHKVVPNDPWSHFTLAELSGDAREYDIAWSLFAPTETKMRALIHLRRGRYAEAERIYRESNDIEGLVEVYLATGREEEAARIGLTPRQKAVLAARYGRHEEAVRYLQQSDLSDPDVRTALADSLLVLGRWQEAEEYASPDVRERIRAEHGPEASAVFAMLKGPGERRRELWLHYRAPLSQWNDVRIDTLYGVLSGFVPELGDRSEDMEATAAVFGWVPALGWRVEAGAHLWKSDALERVGGTAQIEHEAAPWRGGVAAELDVPWTDHVAAVAFGGTRQGARVWISGSPREQTWGYVSLSESVLHLEGAEDFDAPDRFGRLFHAGARFEYRLWAVPQESAPAFYDAHLRSKAYLETQFSLVATYDWSDFRGEREHLEVVPILERVRMLTLGPSFGWTLGGWGGSLRAFVGRDPARFLSLGELRGAGAELTNVSGDPWKVTLSVEYVNERQEAAGGAGWNAHLGVNRNF